MHKFGFYFKKGRALASLVLKKKSFLDRVLLGLYFVGSLFGKLFFFLRPLFLIGDQNIGLMVNETHDIEFNKIFEGVNDKKRYTSLLVSSIFVDALLAGLLLLLGIPSFIFLTILPGQFIPLIMTIVFSIFFLFTAIMLSLCYAPSGYIAAKGTSLSAGDVTFLSRRASRNNKGKIFLNALTSYGITFLIVAAVVIVVYLLLYVFSTPNTLIVFEIISIVLVLGLIFSEMFFFPYFKVGCEASFYAIYSDAVETKHIVIAKKNSSTFEEYVALFEDDKEEN